MRKFAILAAVAALAIAAGQASAGEDRHAGESISVETMKQNISALGYDVRRIKAEDGIFKVWIVERESGGEVKAKFSAQSGDLIRARLAK